MEDMSNSTENVPITEASQESVTYFMGTLSTIEMSVAIFNVLIGLPTHSYVMWLIVMGTGSGIATDIFNLNLSVCEIGICLSFLFTILVNWFSSVQMLAYFFTGLAITGRPLFQCLICVERYLAVVHPVTFLKFKPLRYRVVCSAVVWIITLGSCLCCLFLWFSLNFYAYTWYFSVQFFLFLSIQLFCCVSVLRALKQSGPGERGREREEENHMKRRAFYIILITTVSTVIIYLPYCVSGFLHVFAQQFIKVFWFIGFVFYVLAGFVQPFLYLHRAGKLSCLCSL